MSNFSPTTRGRAWIAVIHEKNFISMGLKSKEYNNPEYLCNVLSALWEESGKERTCAVAVCISKEGLYHCHMALYGNTTTLKKVSDILYKSHVEPQLGGKRELALYMKKEGKYAEKGEQVLFSRGIDNVQDVQGKRNDLDAIEELLDKGLSPQEILKLNFRYYRYEHMILNCYIDKRLHDAPLRINIICEWHVGDSGTGKTYYYEQLCKEYGVSNIYMLTDYDNNASGGLDSYMKVGAPEILFMDEFKGFGISYQKLLTILTGYSRMQTHSRYSNCFNLWNRVIITSVYPPEVVYQNMVAIDNQDLDSFKQLMRRITTVVYHYKADSEYKTFSIAGMDYSNYENLKNMVLSENYDNGFTNLLSNDEFTLPFTED